MIDPDDDGFSTCEGDCNTAQTYPNALEHLNDGIDRAVTALILWHRWLPETR